MRVNLRTVQTDVLLAAVLAALSVATLASQTAGRFGWDAYLLSVLTVAPIALRQVMPVGTMVVILGAMNGYSLLGYGDFPSGGIGLLVSMFTVATLRSRRVAAVMYVVTVATTALAYLMVPNIAWSQFVQATLVMLGAWVLGASTRRWAERAERLATEAARAVANERVRIARELHDIVAHHMSVISLQAGLAEYVIDTDVPTARTAIGTVGEAGREALTEMRRLLHVLRVDDDSDSDYSPQPGLAQVDELVARTRGTGLGIDVSVAGRVRQLPQGPDLCAYRMIQESLTNVLKHAGPATARIELDYGERTLTITVRDNGSTAPPQSPTAHGIRGMRERAELYGGVLTAERAKEGGFEVVLRLPMDEVA